MSIFLKIQQKPSINKFNFEIPYNEFGESSVLVN